MIARCADASERQRAGGPVSGRFQLTMPARMRLAEHLVFGRIVGQQTCRQTKARGVGAVDGGIQKESYRTTAAKGPKNSSSGQGKRQ